MKAIVETTSLIPASSEEVKFYEKIIYPVQDRILSVVEKVFRGELYLTGGTALSRFYLHHRLSEDIDLFANVETIRTVIPALTRAVEKLGYEVRIDTATASFGRLFVPLEGEKELKIDIVIDYPVLEDPIVIQGFYIDTLTNIAVNKITAFVYKESRDKPSSFEDRAELKDLVDLYCMVREKRIDLEEILELADKKRVPVPYESLLAINTTGLTGSVLLLRNIQIKDLNEFLRELKEVLEENIKKKVHEAEKEIGKIIRSLLWDHPFKHRKLDVNTAPILQRRAQALSYPKRLAVLKMIKRVCPQHENN